MIRHRKTRRQIKKQRKILIIGSLSLLLFLCVGYAAFSTNLSITAKGNIKEKSRVIQAWNVNSQTDFHSDFYKQNIVSATFLNNNNVPSNATESWNVSEDKDKGGVMAWVIPNNEDNTKYDLYIGAKDGVIANEDSNSLFHSFTAITSINFNNNFDTSNTVKMDGMFYKCWGLTTLDVSSFDTRNVTNMANMFDGSTEVGMNLIEIKGLENFDTHNVISMDAMFGNCKSLKSLNVNSWDTSNVVSMQYMFANCSSLTELNLSNWDTSNVTNMHAMFSMYMYPNNNLLSTINICGFNTSKVTDMYNIFAFIKNLKNVYVGPNWTTANTTNNAEMFYGSGISSVTTGQC